MAAGCEQVAALPDPIGEMSNLRQPPERHQVGQMRVPLGVFGMIYESRPNVTIDAAVARHQERQCGDPARRLGGVGTRTRRCWRLVRDALVAAGLPADAVQGVQTPTAPPSAG